MIQKNKSPSSVVELKSTKKISHLIKLLISLAFIAISFYYMYIQRDDLAVLLSVRRWDIVKLLGFMLLYEVVSAARFASLYKALGAEVGNLESLGLSKLANALNVMLTAQAGGIARAVYLKSRYNLPYSQTPVVFLGSVVVSMSMGAFIIIFLTFSIF